MQRLWWCRPSLPRESPPAPAARKGAVQPTLPRCGHKWKDLSWTSLTALLKSQLSIKSIWYRPALNCIAANLSLISPALSLQIFKNRKIYNATTVLAVKMTMKSSARVPRATSSQRCSPMDRMSTSRQLQSHSTPTLSTRQTVWIASLTRRAAKVSIRGLNVGLGTSNANHQQN